jgi:hypothetical protein
VRYGITRTVLEGAPFLSISAEEFQGVKAAQRNLLILLSIEEKFAALLENYAEYERELLSLALGHTIFRCWEWSTLIGDLQTVNRRLANVLTMARAYIDSIRHDLNEVYGPGNQVTEQIVQEFRSAYDSSLGYRVMEALRNHIQHRGFPIGSISYPSEWQGDGNVERARLRSRVAATLDITGLQDNPKFKPVVLKELEAAGTPSDATGFLREYLEKLSGVHEQVRKLSTEIETWQEICASCVQRYRHFSGGVVLGMVAVVEREGRWLDKVAVFEQPMR